jgi:hypothetical protein
MWRWAFATTAVLAGLVARSVAAPTEATTEALVKAVQDGRASDAVKTFSALEHPSADDEYLAGYALMALHRPDDAAPHLDAAKARGWSKWRGWTSVESMLDRVAEVRRLAPPALDPPLDAAIEVHVGPPTAWSAPVLRAVPEFAAVGRRIFGADLPRERLYLFSDYKTYGRFFRALFDVEIPNAWQDGTGTTNVVVYCEQDSHGKATGPAGDPDTIGDVLHEFGHAWCETYLIDRYGREWTSPAFRHPWLDESVADVIASLRERGFLERRIAWLKTEAKSVPAPTFAALTSYDGFYKAKDVHACYWLSAAFVAELVGPLDSAPARIREILDEIGKTGDVEASVLAATGKDLHKEFAKVVARFW